MSPRKRAFLVAGVMLALIFGTVWQLLAPNPVATRDSGTYHGTTVAELREVKLEDGSRMLLGARTRTVSEFGSERRLIALENGEAWFEVTPDTTRPFVVSAGVGNIVATGTAFSVRVNNNKVTVTVAKGGVAVTGYASDQDQEPILVHAGERIHYDEGGKLSAVSSLELAKVAAWREGQRIYAETPLEEVIADLNRFSQKPVIITEQRLNSIPVTAEFEQFADVEGVLAVLDEILTLEIVELSYGYDLIYEAP